VSTSYVKLRRAAVKPLGDIALSPFHGLSRRTTHIPSMVRPSEFGADFVDRRICPRHNYYGVRSGPFDNSERRVTSLKSTPADDECLKTRPNRVAAAQSTRGAHP